MHDTNLSIVDTGPNARPALDPDVRAALIAQHMGLVHHIASRMAAAGSGILDRDDLVSYGTIGLIEAIDRYDHERGPGLAGFAFHRIRGAMLDAARGLDPLPRSVRHKVKLLDRATSSLTLSLGRDPSHGELCAAAGLTERESRDAIAVAARLAIPLESVAWQGDTDGNQVCASEPADPSDEDFTARIESRELIEDLSEAVSVLPEREKLVIALYFKEQLDLVEIARILDISPSRVSQLKTRALARLRVSLCWHQAA